MLSVATPLGLEGGCDAHPWISSSVSPAVNIQKHHVSTGKQASKSPLSQVTCPWSTPTSQTTNESRLERNGTTYSNDRLGFQLDVSQLAVGTKLARNGENDHALIGVDAARDVLKLDREHVDGDQASVLAAAAVVTVRHGVVHVRVSDDLTGLRVHFRGVPVRLLVFEVMDVVMVSGGRPAATETCDGDVAIEAKKTVVASGIDVRILRERKV